MTKQLLICSLLLLSTLCLGQASFTTVNATLVDGSSQVWSNATVIASLRPAPNNPGQPLNNGLPITDSPQTVVTDGTGAFTLILDDTSHITPAGATWIFNIYPNASVPNGSSITLAVTGTTQNFSGVLSSILITPAVFAAPSVNRAYTDAQVTGGTGGVYWNTVSNTLKGCTFLSGICTWVTIGSVSVPGNHFYIPFNNGTGGFTASSNLQFNDVTNIFSTPHGVFTDISTNFLISSTANGATTGFLRHASTDQDCWRNNANSANLCLSKNASDQFIMPGSLLNTTLVTPTISSPTTTGTDTGTETLTNKTLTSPIVTNPSTTGTDSGTETLVNKTLTSPVLTTPVINGASTGTGVQGTDPKLATAATISVTPGTPVCADANGGITTTGCTPAASFNAPQKTNLAANTTFATNGTQQTFITETVTIPSTSGTYRVLVSYVLWVTTGANVCSVEVVDATNSRAYAASGANNANVGYAGFAGSELSAFTYVAGATPTFRLDMNCNGNAIPVTINMNNSIIYTMSPNEPSYISVTPVLSN